MAIKNPGRSSRAKAAETRKTALELRTPGLSYRQIAIDQKTQDVNYAARTNPGISKL